jgi:hypothetical protein
MLSSYPDDAKKHPNARSWLPLAFAYLNINLGVEYRDIVSKWLNLERTTTWESPPLGLKPENQPNALSVWQKKRYSGREPDFSAIEFVASFSVEVWRWWISLQPEWRRIAPGGKLSSPNLKVVRTDWILLDKKGVNGWFGLLVCMKWWGLGLNYMTEEQEELKRDWVRAIHDISVMMDGLVAYRASIQ